MHILLTIYLKSLSYECILKNVFLQISLHFSILGVFKAYHCFPSFFTMLNFTMFIYRMLLNTYYNKQASAWLFKMGRGWFSRFLWTVIFPQFCKTHQLNYVLIQYFEKKFLNEPCNRQCCLFWGVVFHRN